MYWSWQLPDWPNFSYDSVSVESLEAEFMREVGMLIGQFSSLQDTEREEYEVSALSEEAFRTSRIEGDLLDRESLRSSIRANLGLQVDPRVPARPREKGIADLVIASQNSFADPLSMGTLNEWHRMLMAGQLLPEHLGSTRAADTPMQIVSGDLGDPEIHFEAPPGPAVAGEMERLVEWLNSTQPTRSAIPIPALTRSGLAHLWFETIHPYSDGNGRIGRAIAEKTLSQAIGRGFPAPLSKTIEKKRSHYYAALADTRYSNEVTDWLLYFADTVISAVQSAREEIAFTIEKGHFFDRFRDELNSRQEKVLLRVFRAGPDGFTGGLSALNYVSLTKTSPATARRDLRELVKMGAMVRTGERKGTRYWLCNYLQTS